MNLSIDPAPIEAPASPSRAPCRAGHRKRESRSELKPEFHATERLVERWAQQAYDRAPTRVSMIYIVMRIAAKLPLQSDRPRMDEDVLLLDTQVFAKADPSVKRFCEVWYCQGGSMAQKAARLGITREALYCQRKIQIAYIRDRLQALGLDI